MDHSLVSEVAVSVIAAWALAVLAKLFRQPLILAYLGAGFLAGPHGLGWIRGDEHIEVISEIGLSLLLFMVGLEIDLKKMLQTGRTITLTAAAQIFGGVGLGLAFFAALGFPMRGGRLDAVYLAIAMALSSTVIIVKLLHDKRELDTLAGRITLGVLVVQDLFAILFLAFQPNLQQPSPEVLAWSLGKVALLVGAAFLASRYGLPALFRVVASAPEVVLVGALAWCFLCAGLASWLELSREMGALVAGVALSTFPYALDVAAKVISLRDFFVTLFFVALGLRTPAPTPSLVLGAVVIGVFVVASRFLTVTPLLHRLHASQRVSLLPALNLSQISEFSLVILVLGAKAGHIDPSTLDLGAYAFAFAAVASSYAIGQSETLLRVLQPWLTRVGLRDLGDGAAASAHGRPAARVMMLGFFTTASSLLAELEKNQPKLLSELVVVDFNPLVHQRLRERGVNVIYGDISKRETLLHAGAGEARVLICSLPDTILKGSSNLTMVRQLREINPTGRIIATTESLAGVADLYAAGADYVRVPRVTEAVELGELLVAALDRDLAVARTAQDQRLSGRNEVIA